MDFNTNLPKICDIFKKTGFALGTGYCLCQNRLKAKMAYVNVLEWKAEQVSEWLRGLDDSIFPYAHFFLNNNINGQEG